MYTLIAEVTTLALCRTTKNEEKNRLIMQTLTTRQGDNCASASTQTCLHDEIVDIFGLFEMLAAQCKVSDVDWLATSFPPPEDEELYRAVKPEPNAIFNIAELAMTQSSIGVSPLLPELMAGVGIALDGETWTFAKADFCQGPGL